MSTIRRDPQSGREIKTPDVHAGKLHALLAGLDCLHDTPLVFANAVNKLLGKLGAG